jgi:DNA-binding CsgD family transcriptional regulator
MRRAHRAQKIFLACAFSLSGLSLGSRLKGIRSLRADRKQRQTMDVNQCELLAREDRIERWDHLLARLTPREREVLITYIENPCQKRVAKILGTKEQTVRNQLASIVGKLEVGSREEMLILVLRSYYLSRAAGMVEMTMES